MDKLLHYDFRIDALTPQTLPMGRLAEYLAELVKLLGNKEHIHFVKLRKGSAIAEFAVDPIAYNKVSARLGLVGAPNAPEDLIASHRSINRLLQEDNASAYLRLKGGAKILEFRGVKMPLTEELILIEQGNLDGVVIRVGGKDKTVPVTLEGENRRYYLCNTSREIAKQLASYLFGQTIRVYGKSKWRRTQEGTWELESFDIQSFETLSETSLSEIISSLRKIEGSEWNAMNNPHQELKKLRGE